MNLFFILILLVKLLLEMTRINMKMKKSNVNIIIMDRNENFEVTKVYYSQIPKSSLLKKKSKLRVLLLSLFRKLHTNFFFRKELNRKKSKN